MPRTSRIRDRLVLIVTFPVRGAVLGKNDFVCSVARRRCGNFQKYFNYIQACFGPDSRLISVNYRSSASRKLFNFPRRARRTFKTFLDTPTHTHTGSRLK